MQSFDIPENDPMFAEVLELIFKGEPFILVIGGKPVGTVVPIIEEPAVEKKKRQLGSMRGEIVVPDDFDTMFRDEIEDVFYGSEIFPTVRK